MTQPVKKHQKFPHESETWRAHYGMRSLVELSNKLIKDANAEDLGNKGKRSGRSFAFHHLASALAAASSNIRRIIRFSKEESKRIATNPTRTRRRTDVHGEPLPRQELLPPSDLASSP